MTNDSDDLGRRLQTLAARAEGVPLPSGPAVRAAGDRRRTRRRRRLGVAAVVVVVAGAVTAGVLSQQPSKAIMPESGTAPPSIVPTTAPTTTVPASLLEQAAPALDGYVAAQAEAVEAAYADRRATTATLAAHTFDASVSVHSTPVDDDGTVVAVAAFSYSATGHPVEVLSYTAGQWSPVASLGPVQTSGSGDELVLTPKAPVSVTDVTGDGQPDFLVLSMGATSNPGFVVSQDGGGGTWRYVPAKIPDRTSDFSLRTPQFQDGKLVSTYDECRPDCAAGPDVQIVWTYEPSSGVFWAPDPPGWLTTVSPGAA